MTDVRRIMQLADAYASACEAHTGYLAERDALRDALYEALERVKES